MTQNEARQSQDITTTQTSTIPRKVGLKHQSKTGKIWFKKQINHILLKTNKRSLILKMIQIIKKLAKDLVKVENSRKTRYISCIWSNIKTITLIQQIKILGKT